MKEGTYITIQSWMRTELGLTGNELLAFALVFGFCQDDETEFTGSMNYIAEWLGSTRQTAITTMKKLVEKGLVERVEIKTNGVTFAHFRIIQGVKNFDRGVSKDLTGGCQKILPNNNKDITKKDNNRFIPPTLEEIEEYCRQRGNNVDAKRVYDYYSEAKWKDGRGNPVRNWKQKIIAVWERSATPSASAQTVTRNKVAYEGKDYDSGFDKDGNFVWG